MESKDPTATGKVEFTTYTATTPNNAGTLHPVSLTIIFSTGNFNQPITGHLVLGEIFTHEFDTSSSVGTVNSVSLRLNGMMPNAPDDWRPTRFKLDIIRNGAREEVFDRQWNQWFDEQNRVQTIYTRTEADTKKEIG